MAVPWSVLSSWVHRPGGHDCRQHRTLQVHEKIASTWHMSFPTLQWRQNDRDGVSNYQCLDCLLKRFFRHRSTKTSKPRVTGHCEENPHVNGGSSPTPPPPTPPPPTPTHPHTHKGPVTWKMFPFGDVIMIAHILIVHSHRTILCIQQSWMRFWMAVTAVSRLLKL